jgi:putative ABC transport system ATP-binding protein
MEDIYHNTKRGDEMSSENFIDIKNLSFKLDEKTTILENINLDIKQGECVVLQGISGSGKTTLLGIIAGLQRPSSGKIVVNSQHIAKMPQHHLSKFLQQTVGIIFQEFNLIEHLSVMENVMTPLIPTKLSHKQILLKASLAMQKAQIEHKQNSLASTLSGGEKQRCCIARAIVNEPSLILCDEPTANLDKDNSLAFIDMLDMLHAQGHTIVIATHDPLFDSLRFTHRKIKIEDGQIKDE